MSIALFIGAAVGLGGVVPVDATAAPGRGKSRKGDSGLERSQFFVEQGDAAFERGDYEEAIAKYRGAYYVLTAEERASYAGSIPVRNAMIAYDRQVAVSLERSLLEGQLGFVTEYLETVKDNPSVTTPPSPEIITELEEKRDEIGKKIEDLSVLVAPAPPAETETETETEGENEESLDVVPADNELSPPIGKADQNPSPSKAGIALAASGGVVVGIGAGVFAGWWTVRNQAPGLADMEPGYEEGTPERAAYLVREEDRARSYLISGAVVIGVGVAVAATGVALIIKNRRSTTLSLTPGFGRTHAGLSIAGRF